MKCPRLLFIVLFLAVLATTYPLAQTPSGPPCTDAAPPEDGSNGTSCVADGIGIGNFHATPFPDAICPNGVCPTYNSDSLGTNLVSLYGSYGNSESTGMALTHFNQGAITLAPAIVPRCTDGTIPLPNTNCQNNNQPPAIVFLFIGFSNCDIEICGGSRDAWDGQDGNQTHLAGQPCSTQCANWHNPNANLTPWNQVTNHGSDGVTQQSFIYQVYHDPNNILVGSHVAVFNGAISSQFLAKWDPTAAGWYTSHDCPFDNNNNYHPECNYYRVATDLAANGYSEKQVQAIFLKSSDNFPKCDLKGNYCETGFTEPDAYTAERFLGNILRYLKCCTFDLNGNSTGVPRYLNLQQVFLTGRIYGGYANGQQYGNHCLMPEPYAYEYGFAVQRAIVAQINRTTTDYVGDVRYPEKAPWVDWGPYLWADSVNVSPSTGLNWCDYSTRGDSHCLGNPGDVRYGDPLDFMNLWGDHTHPTATGLKKVSDQLVIFIGKDPNHIKAGSPFVVPWIQQ